MSTSGRPAELWRWSARQLSRAVRSGEVSAREVVESHLARTARIDPAVNAFVEVSADEARSRAAAVDALPVDERSGLLLGVPVAVKDNTDQAGHVTTCGVVSAAGNVAAQDAAVVAAMRAQGAVFTGRTNLPAFGLRHFSENDLFGRTLNPWSPERTPGGSSGGAAAAVAGGAVPVAHANDIGGSIRYPAAVCGVVGLRPTVGRVPKFSAPSPVNPAPSPSETLMAVEGPIARTVDDLRLALQAMSAFDRRDPVSLPLPYRDEPPVPAGSRIGVLRSIPGVNTCPENLQAVERAARWLQESGFDVVDVDLPEVSEADRLWSLLLYEDLRPDLRQMHELGGSQLSAALDHDFAYAADLWGSSPTLETYVRGHVRRNELVTRMEEFFQHTPFLLTPFSAETAPEHGADHERRERAVALLENQWPMKFVPCLGLPAATVPTGVLDGLPGSVQIVGGRFTESGILDVAQALEDHAGGTAPIDPVEVRTGA